MQAIPHVAVVCIICLGCTWTLAQSNPGVILPETVAPQTQMRNAGDEAVGPGDLIYLSVTGAPELTRAYRVSRENRLSLPLLQEPVLVADMGPAAIAREVSDALVRNQILVAPIVSAQVLEYRSRQVTISGAVKAPVTIEATGDMKLLDAISRAQGLASDAGPEIIVSAPTSAAAEAHITRVSVKDLINGKESALNIPLHGGEEIRVPPAAMLYIAGNVKTPGAYPMKEMGGLSVLEALALSQGTLPYTTKMAYVYRTVSGSTERQEVAVPLREILQRKAQDVQLQPNDVLYIPENSRARLNASVLDHIVAMAAGPALPMRR